jgi:hypothetical protein
MSGSRVLILTGQFEGEEGICLGECDMDHAAISPDSGDEILSLTEREYALLIDLSVDPESN